MRALYTGAAVFLCCVILTADDGKVFPKKFTSGDMAMSVSESGVITLSYKNTEMLAVQNPWFMNEKWQALPRKENDRLSVEVVGETDALVTLRIKDARQDFLKSYEQTVALTPNSLTTVIDYEYSADIGTWHLPIYLFARHLSGMKYKSLLADGTTKEGAISEVIPDKVIYGLDGNVNVKEMTFSLKDLDLRFALSGNGWNFCDHRGAPWMKEPKVFMLLNSISSKKKDAKEHYEIKVSIIPNRT